MVSKLLEKSLNLSLELVKNPPFGITKTPQIQFPVAEVKEPLTTDEGAGESEKPPQQKKNHLAFHANFSELFKHIGFAKRKCSSSPLIR